MRIGKKIVGVSLALALLCGNYTGFVYAEEDLHNVNTVEDDVNFMNPVSEANSVKKDEKVVKEEGEEEVVVNQKPVTEEVKEEEQVSTFALRSSGDIPINETTFPDAAFRDFILGESYGSDGVLTQSEINGKSDINITNKDVKNVKGIEYFTELVKFYSKAEKLETLDLSNNLKIDNINLASCLSLESIALGNNHALKNFTMDTSGEISKFAGKLDTSGCVNLESILIRRTNLETVDFSRNTKLTSIQIDSCNLKALDISNNVNLDFLKCSNTLLEALDVSNCPKLKGIDAKTNVELSSLVLGDITELTSLDVSKSLLTSLDISKLTELTDLSISFTNIHYLNNTNNTKLTRFSYSEIRPYVVDMDKTKILDLRDFITEDILNKVTAIKVNGGTLTAYNKNPIIENIDPTKSMFIQARLPGKVSGSPVAISTYITPQGINEWITPLKINSWGVSDVAKTPLAEAAYGSDTVKYTYSDTKEGTYTDVVPSAAGIYYVKASVAETKMGSRNGMYTGLDSNPVKFTINDWTSPLTIANWKYGDTPSTPQIRAVAGTDDIVFEYAKDKDGTYSDKVPSELGTWYVRAVLKPTTEYVGLESEAISFSIHRNDNAWVKTPTLKDWTMGSNANTPTAEARFGNKDITFQYSQQENGVYRNAIPTEAGVWYMKAMIKGNANYGDLEAITKFEIIHPEITKGLSVTHITGSADNATFTCSGLLEDLTNVYVDGKLLSSDHYILKSGSTILTLHHEYLDTLLPGTHTLKFEYGSQSAEIAFEIVKGKDIDNNNNQNQGNGKDNNQNHAIERVPNTGDNVKLLLWVTMFVMAGTTFFVSILRKKRNLDKS